MSQPTTTTLRTRATQHFFTKKSQEHLEKSAESLAPVPDAFLQGMVLALEMDVRDSCAVFASILV